MLNRLIGEGPIEVAKTVVLVFVTVLAVIALQQLAAARSVDSGDRRDRLAVVGRARDFGQELTTYDYAHPDVQEHRLAPLATPGVVTRVMTAFPDLALYHAVSLGDAPDTWLEELDGGHARVLMMTRSTIQSSNVAPGTHASGLLLCDLSRQASGSWRVSDFRWLTPATQGVS